MLRTVKDACELHPMALEYAMSEQIENLSDVIQRTEKEAGEFFEKNHITRGMELLLSQGLKRLAGRDDQAVFELKQAMGGGKTHSMIALGLLARDPELRQSVVPQIAADAPFDRADVVAVNGRVVSKEASSGVRSPPSSTRRRYSPSSGRTARTLPPSRTGSSSSAIGPP